MKKRILGLVGCLIGAVALSGCVEAQLQVKEEKVQIEYGKEISLDASDYLDNSEKVLEKVEVTSDIKNEKGKKYPAVGKYKINFGYKKQEAEVVVEVVDSVKPKFVEFKDAVDVYQNGKLELDGLYKAEDLSGVELVYDNSNVNYSEGGSYELTVEAKDKWGNSEFKKVAVNVLPVTVELDKESESIYVGDTLQLTASVNVPEGKVVFTSSDGEVASVDENGLVSGVKSGEVTITSELNGIKDECKVVVSEKPSKPSSSGSSGNRVNTSSNSSNTSGGSASGGSTDVVIIAPSTEVPSVSATPSTSREAFDLINAERVALGLEPAVWDAECERIALIRAQEVYDVEVMNESTAHEGFWKFQDENIALAECVAYGYPYASGAVNAWMNSSGHRNTLMRENRVHLAVAYCGNRWVAVNSR